MEKPACEQKKKGADECRRLPISPVEYRLNG